LLPQHLLINNGEKLDDRSIFRADKKS